MAAARLILWIMNIASEFPEQLQRSHTDAGIKLVHVTGNKEGDFHKQDAAAGLC